MRQVQLQRRAEAQDRRVSGQEEEVWEAGGGVENVGECRDGGKDWIYDSVVQRGVQMMEEGSSKLVCLSLLNFRVNLKDQS